MHELTIEVDAASTLSNAITVKVVGWDENHHAVCLFVDDVLKPNWFENLLGITWSDKLAKTHAKAEQIVRDYQNNTPEMERILFPYKVTKK
jgi:hypothetical protein